MPRSYAPLRTTCQDCRNTVSVRGLKRHQRSQCPATADARATAQATATKERQARRNEARRNLRVRRVPNSKGLIGCAQPGCPNTFAPKNDRHACCSQRCRDAYKYQPGYAPMVSDAERLASLEEAAKEQERLAEAAFARLLTPEASYRLWFDVLGIAA